MSYRHILWVFEHSKSKGTARLVLLALADFANDTDTCFANLDTLMSRANASERSVRDGLRELEAIGEIETVRGGGRGRASDFRFCAMGAESAPIDAEKGPILPPLAQNGAESAPIGDKKRGRFFQEKGQIFPRKGAESAPQSKTLTTTDPTTKNQSARAEESSSTSAEPEIDDDDDLPLPSVPLGLWSKQLYNAQQLRSAARNLGIEHGLDHDWAGYSEWVKRATASELVALLGWLIHYGDLPVGARNRIESLPAIVRTHLKRDERAALNLQQMGYLERYIARAWYSDNLDSYVDEMVEETVKRHGGGAWVPADASLFPYGGH